jgi:hypothetical protein
MAVTSTLEIEGGTAAVVNRQISPVVVLPRKNESTLQYYVVVDASTSMLILVLVCILETFSISVGLVPK